MKRARTKVSLKRETVRVLKPTDLAVAGGAIDNSERCITLLVAVAPASDACAAG